VKALTAVIAAFAMPDLSLSSMVMWHCGF